MKKKGQSEFEKLFAFMFGVGIFVTFVSVLFSSGVFAEIFSAFSVFGVLGGLLGLLFIIMVILAVWEIINEK